MSYRSNERLSLLIACVQTVFWCIALDKGLSPTFSSEPHKIYLLISESIYLFLWGFCNSVSCVRWISYVYLAELSLSLLSGLLSLMIIDMFHLKYLAAFVLHFRREIIRFSGVLEIKYTM